MAAGGAGFGPGAHGLRGPLGQPCNNLNISQVLLLRQHMEAYIKHRERQGGQIGVYQPHDLEYERTAIKLLENCGYRHDEFRAPPTPHDGSCFFHAVSDQLSYRSNPPNPNPPNATQLRSRVVAYIRLHQFIQSPNGQFDIWQAIQTSTGMNVNTYCNRMSSEATWADELIVHAMANLLMHDITVYTSSQQSTPVTCRYFFTGGAASNRATPLLLGHFHENHYQSLQPTGTISAAQFIRPSEFHVSNLLRICNTNRYTFDGPGPTDFNSFFVAVSGHLHIRGFTGHNSRPFHLRQRFMNEQARLNMVNCPISESIRIMGRMLNFNIVVITASPHRVADPRWTINHQDAEYFPCNTQPVAGRPLYIGHLYQYAIDYFYSLCVNHPQAGPAQPGPGGPRGGPGGGPRGGPPGGPPGAPPAGVPPGGPRPQPSGAPLVGPGPRGGHSSFFDYGDVPRNQIQNFSLW